MEPLNKDLLTLFRENIVTIKKIAASIRNTVPYVSLQLDDLVQAGAIGFIDAYHNYNHLKGASFNTYANIRIRGAILDEIRRVDWSPRSVHRRSRMMSSARSSIENSTGKTAKSQEIAQYLEIDLQELNKIMYEVNAYKVCIMEDLSILDECIADPNSHDMVDQLYRQSFLDALEENIDSLDEIERQVINFYYKDDLNQRQIGDIINVSESRVCQIKRKAVQNLQKKMQIWIEAK